MSTFLSDSNDSIQDIIEFYKIQPGIKEFHLEKIEEYLLVLKSKHQNVSVELEDLSSVESIDSVKEMCSILNFYIREVSEEIGKVFAKENTEFLLVDIPSDCTWSANEIIELIRDFNLKNKDRWNLNNKISCLNSPVPEEVFLENIFSIIKEIVDNIDSETVVRVEDLI